MTDTDHLANEVESLEASGERNHGVNDVGARRLAMVLGCVVIALVVVVAVVIFNPPEANLSTVQKQVSAGAVEAGPSLPPAQSEELPASTIRLPSVAIPVPAEELEREAEAVSGRLVQTYPDAPQALHVAAMFASMVRRSEDAEKLWQRCIELAPEGTVYYVNLASIAMERGDSQMASEVLRKALDAGCKSADVYHHLAVALTKLGQCEEAEEVIGKALAQYPESGAYRLVLGQVQLKAGKLSEAEANLRKAIELGSGTASAYFALANACGRQKKQEEAAKFREMFTKLKAEAPLDKQQRFEILSTAESRRTVETILCEASVVERQQENSLESERLLLRAIAVNPSNPVPCHLLAELYERAGMVAEARVVWARLVEIEPLQVRNYAMLAQSHARLGEPESAEAVLKLAVAMRPESVEGYAMLAQFLLERGNAPKARWYAQEAIRRQPSVAGYEFLASACQMAGDTFAADAARTEAMRLMAERAQETGSRNEAADRP